MKEIRTRFAPSPTGYMHIGNLRTALYEYLIAKGDGGKFILRIEDTDQERFVEGAEDVIYGTLNAVGLKHDEGPDVGGNYGPYVQSERLGIYKEYAQKLVELGGAYYCFCDEERLDRLRKEAQEKKETYKYDGKCKRLTKEEIEEKIKNGEKYVIRQSVPLEGQTTFEDEVYGSVTVDNASIEEGVLLKSDGYPTYNFANVVDDHLMNITHVVRGSEYLSSTPKYNLMYKAFGWEIPKYIHVPPVMKDAQHKLSKRNGDASFEDLQKRGFLKEAILNYIALLGWSPSDVREKFTLNELVEAFNVSGISKSPSIFDIQKLRWMNSLYVKEMTPEDFHGMALPYYENVLTRHPDFEFLSTLLQSRVDVFEDIPEMVRFIETLPEYDLDIYVNKKFKTNLENSLQIIKETREILAQIAEWNQQNIEEYLFQYIADKGLKNGFVLWPVRIAIAGQKNTPGGAVEMAYLVGKDESLYRMDKAVELLEAEVNMQ